MQDFAIAAKAYIVENGRVLLLRRQNDDPHQAGQWDIPGGRLERAENPFDGVRRETREETGLEIDIVMPLAIQHFTRDDGQLITMIIFWCRLAAGEAAKEIVLSEHDAYEWHDVAAVNDAPAWLRSAAENYMRHCK